MTPDREDDGLLDRLIGQILEQPFPEDPPPEVRRPARLRLANWVRSQGGRSASSLGSALPWPPQACSW